MVSLAVDDRNFLVEKQTCASEYEVQCDLLHCL